MTRVTFFRSVLALTASLSLTFLVVQQTAATPAAMAATGGVIHPGHA